MLREQTASAAQPLPQAWIRVFRAGLALLVGCLPLLAADAIWTGGGANSNWNTPANWSGGSIPANGDRVVFNATSTARLTNICNLTLTNLSIQVVAPTGAVSISVSGGSLSLGAGGIDLSAATQNLTVTSSIAVEAAQAWAVVSGRTLDLSAVALGAGTLTLSGEGSVILDEIVSGAGSLTVDGVAATSSANHTFTGGVTVQSGVLIVANNSTPTSGAVSSGPFGTGTLTISGGTVRNNSPVTSRTCANAVAITGSCTIGSAALPGSLVFQGGLTISGSPTLTTPAGFSGVTFGTLPCELLSDLAIAGGGPVALTGGLTCSANRQISQQSSGTLTIAGPMACGANTLALTGSGVVINGAALTGTCGGLIIDGPDVTVSSTTSDFAAGITLQSGMLRIGADSMPTAGTVVTGPLGTGTLTISGGTVQNTSSFTPRTCANAVAITGSCTIGSAALPGSLVFQGGVTISGTPTLTTPAGFSGIIFGTLPCELLSDLIVAGDSPLTLTGGFTCSANRQIAQQSSGTLTIAGPLACGANTLTLTGSGAITNGAAFTGTCGGLIIDGPVATISSTTSDFIGGVTLQSGELVIASSSTPTSGVITSGPLGVGTLTIAGGTVRNSSFVNSRTCANAVAVTGSCTIGSGTATERLNFNGGLTVSGAPTVTLPSGFLGATFATLPCVLASDLSLACDAPVTLSGGCTFAATRQITMNGSATTSVSGPLKGREKTPTAVRPTTCGGE